MSRRTRDVWLPDGASFDQVRTLDMGDPMGAHAFRDRLKDVDPSRLDMIRTTGECRFAPPNRYLIVYKSESGNHSWLLIQDEEGRDCVPDERHWDRLMYADQEKSGGGLLRKFRKHRDMVSAQARAEKERRSEAFRDGLNDRLSHLFDPKVAITSDMKQMVGNAVEFEKGRDERRKGKTQKKKNRRENFAQRR